MRAVARARPSGSGAHRRAPPTTTGSKPASRTSAAATCSASASSPAIGIGSFGSARFASRPMTMYEMVLKARTRRVPGKVLLRRDADAVLQHFVGDRPVARGDRVAGVEHDLALERCGVLAAELGQRRVRHGEEQRLAEGDRLGDRAAAGERAEPGRPAPAPPADRATRTSPDGRRLTQSAPIVPPSRPAPIRPSRIFAVGRLREQRPRRQGGERRRGAGAEQQRDGDDRSQRRRRTSPSPGFRARDIAVTLQVAESPSSVRPKAKPATGSPAYHRNDISVGRNDDDEPA